MVGTVILFDMESPIQHIPPNNLEPSNKIESVEKEPKVEHLVFGQNYVLIKTSFPWRDSIAYSCILIFPPSEKTYEEVLKDSAAYYPEGMSEAEEKALRRGWESGNKPHVFNSTEGAQAWFDYHSFQNREERTRVANFLGIEDKGI